MNDFGRGSESDILTGHSIIGKVEGRRIVVHETIALIAYPDTISHDFMIPSEYLGRETGAE